jgi:hypothetical protein
MMPETAERGIRVVAVLSRKPSLFQMAKPEVMRWATLLNDSRM